MSSSQPAAGFTPYDGLSDGEAIDLVGLLHRSRKVLFVAALLGLLGGIGAYLLLGPAYAATVSVLVDRQVSTLDDDETRTFGTRGVDVVLIQSPLIVERAVVAGELDKLPSLAEAADPTEAIISGLQVKRISGDEGAYSNIIQITYQNPSKEDATKVLDEIVTAYDRYLADQRDARGNEVRTEQAANERDLESKIAAKQKEIMEFRQTAPLTFTAAPGESGTFDADKLPNPYTVRVNEIERNRRDTQAEIDATEAKIRAVETLRKEGSSPAELEFYVLNEISKQNQSGGGQPGAGSSPLAGQSMRSTLDAALLQAQLKEQRLLRSFGAGHEKVTSARQDIETILKSYELHNITPPTVSADGELTQNESVVDLYLGSLRNKLVELSIRMEELDESYDAASKKAKEVQGFELTGARLDAELERLRNSYNVVAESADRFDIDRDRTGFRMERTGPIKTDLALKRAIKIVGASMLIVLALAAAMQYIREMSNTSLRTLEDVKRQLPGSLLGSVPEFPPASEADITEAERTGLGTDLRYFHRPGSLAAEAYRSVRTALFHLLPEEGKRILQVTSSEAGDGKSTLAGNLGIAMAQSGKRVLIVDADLRKPRVHRLFGVFGGTGLTDVLEGELDWSEAVQGTHIERLHVLAAGSETSLPAELLSGPRIGDVLAEAGKSYDWVIVDTPPLLAVSDPCIVAPHVAGMVMVIRIEKNKREAVQLATEMLSNHNLPLLGVVANETPRESNRYYRTYISDEEQSRGAGILSRT